MIKTLRQATIVLVLFTLLLGGAYPLLITGTAQSVFPRQANGSLIIAPDGKAIGSELIGQEFTKPEYFWGRISATSPTPYNAAASSGSNYSIAEPRLMEMVKARMGALNKAEADNQTPVPIDLATASASGLDPHISPAAARYQAKRVAKARKLPIDQVNQLIEQYTDLPLFGIVGESVVNVLPLNIALDQTKAGK